jgi:hypothetical protein
VLAYFRALECPEYPASADIEMLSLTRPSTLQSLICKPKESFMHTRWTLIYVSHNNPHGLIKSCFGRPADAKPLTEKNHGLNYPGAPPLHFSIFEVVLL